jgi:hypothetical protein
MFAKFLRAKRLSAGLAVLIGLLALSGCSVGVGVGVHPHGHYYYHHHHR